MHHLQNWTTHCFVGLFLLLIPYSGMAHAQNHSTTPKDTLTKTVLIHPVIKTGDNQLILSREHTYKKQLGLGDQLARDFVVAGATDDGLIEFYKNDGKDNEDYLGWRKKVMAPVNGTVALVHHPDTTNTPGQMNRQAEPGRIYIEKPNGIKVSLVHVREIKVEKGEKVKAGEVVARVGNNGNSTGPHTHVGAWKNGTPYQIQVDLYAGHRPAEAY